MAKTELSRDDIEFLVDSVDVMVSGLEETFRDHLDDPEIIEQLSEAKRLQALLHVATRVEVEGDEKEYEPETAPQ